MSRALCRDAPCPRMVLVCCTAIAAGGLASEGLFTGPTDTDDVQQLLETLSASHCTALLPPGATPQLISAALKRWLAGLRPEPLLTYKLVPALTSVTTPNASVAAVLDELPAANRAALLMLLETAHRVARNAAINDTDAAALAAALSPCLLWRERLSPENGATGGASAEDRASRIEPLPRQDEAVFVKLLTHMITHYRTLI
jgi:RhoGAP domain